MNEKCAHIIYTPFSGVGLHGGFRGDKWLKHRIEVFKNYTLKSLLNQSNRSFVHWFSFRPEEEQHPYVKQLAEYLASKNYPFVFTFHGLMYHDDKFTNYSLKNKLRNFLMMVWDCWRYKEIKNPLTILKYTYENKNKTLPERLSRALETIKTTLGDGHEWIYMTRLDSDDMFHRHAVDLIQSQNPAIFKALLFDKGYILNVETGQVGEWNPPTNPPFHTIIFPGEVFLNPQMHLTYYSDFKTHEDIPRIFNCTTLDMKSYCVSYHGKHISTSWNSPLPRQLYHTFKYEPKGYCYTTSGKNISTRWNSHLRQKKNFMIGKEFHGEDKRRILADFGILI